MSDHEAKDAARENVNGRRREGDEKVKEETEGRSFQPAPKSLLTQGAARNRLQDSRWTDVISNSEKQARVGNVERAGN
jgi:hypothetical protein